MPPVPEGFIEEIRSSARSYFHREMSAAHDWFHVQRVQTNADRLVAEYPGADETVVKLGALLHDIGRANEDEGVIDDHAEWGASESESLLRELGASRETSEAVAHCVRAHRYSTGVAPATIEAKIVSDADNLDALGAVGLARCFAHGGELGSPIYDPSLPPAEDDSEAGRTQFNHLHKKVLDLPTRMYTDAGRALAEERARFVREYVQRFEEEVVGTG